MSDNATQNGSTDSELTVFVGALGLVGNERYIKDPAGLVEKAVTLVNSVSGMKGQAVDTVYSRGNYTFTQALDAALEADVEHSAIDWRQELDRQRAQFSENDDRMTDGVRLTVDEKIEQWGLDEETDAELISDLEDDRPIAEIVAEEADISDEEWQDMIDAADTVFDDFDADTDQFTIEDNFDLYLREHRDVIPMDAVDEGRISRAKACAMGRTDERFYNDYFSDPATVDAAILLHDGTDRGMEAVEAARGQNPWVKYPSSCPGTVLEENINGDDDDIINWARYLLETGREDPEGLTDDQEAELRELHTDDELEYMGLEVEADEPSPAQAEPSDAELAAAEPRSPTGLEDDTRRATKVPPEHA